MADSNQPTTDTTSRPVHGSLHGVDNWKTTMMGYLSKPSNIIRSMPSETFMLQDKELRTVFHAVVSIKGVDLEKRTKVFQELMKLRSGVDILELLKMTNHFGNTIFHSLVNNQSDKAILEMVIECVETEVTCSLLQVRNKDKLTPLERAFVLQKWGFVEVLLLKVMEFRILPEITGVRQSPTEVGSPTRTLLHRAFEHADYAAKYLEIHMKSCMLCKLTDAEIMGSLLAADEAGRGNTPWYYLFDRQRDDDVVIEVLKLLREFDIHVKRLYTNRESRSNLLHPAYKEDREKLITFLIDIGVDPKQENEGGRRAEDRRKALSVSAEDANLSPQDSEHYRRLFNKSMEKGYVEAYLNVLLLIGAAGAGKTSAKHVFLGLDPPPLRQSTSLAEEAIRAMSTLRASAMVSGSGIMWDPVKLEKLKQMIAKAIKAGESRGYVVLQSESLPKTKPTEQPKEEVPSTTIAQSPRKSAGHSNSHSAVPSQDRLRDEQEEEFIKLVASSSGSRKLLEVDWVYLIDSGGQPAFHEILPLFIRTASVVAMVLKLDEKLCDKPTIDFYGQNGEKVDSSRSSNLTNMQILQHCSRAMHSRKCLSTVLPCPKVFVVGTHRDRERTCEETRKDKNSELLTRFRSLFGEDNLVCYQPEQQLIFPLNAKTPTEEDQKVAEQFRRSVKKMCSTARVKLPMPWFILEQYLQSLSEKKHRMILSTCECEEQALKLQMNEEDCEAALVYLDKINMFFYRPEHLKGLVFCKAQVWLDKISELIVFVYMLLGYQQASHSSHLSLSDGFKAASAEPSTSELPSLLLGQPNTASGSQGPGLATAPVQPTGTVSANTFPDLTECSTSEWFKFREYGIVTLDILQKFPRHYVEGLFTPVELLKLLTAFLVLAPVRDGSPEYIMPCLLQELTPEELDRHRQLQPHANQSSPAAPQLIQFPDKCVPAGVFTLLIAHLCDFAHWRLCMDFKGNPRCLKRNCVEFDIDIPTDNRESITLIMIDSFEHIEVYIARASKKNCIHICSTIVQVLLDGIEKVAHRLHYGSLRHRAAFICLNPTHTCGSAPHPVDVVGDKWVCSVDKRVRGELTYRQLVWFEFNKPSQPPKGVKDPLDVAPALHKLICLRYGNKRISVPEEVGTHYNTFGILLLEEDKGTRVKAIAHKWNGNAQEINREILQEWVEGKGKNPVSWRTLIEALRDIRLGTLALDIEAAITHS